MTYTAHLLRRDDSEFLTPLPLALRPLRWSWTEPGGPDYAEIAVDGNNDLLWDMLRLLRCPVTIYNRNGAAVWWGYVSDAAFSTDAVDIAVTLDDMANRVAVAYSLVAAGSQTVGTRATTSWTEDTTSSGEYGTKELLASIDGATTAQAENVRDRLLALHKYPLAIPQAAGRKNRTLSIGQYSRGGAAVRGAGRLVCRGWWHTLDWRYYSNSDTTSTQTTQQIADIVTGVGAFLDGADIVDASGVSSSEYRDGDSTALAEVKELLRTRTSGGSNLTATVTPERLLRVEAETASGSDDWLITPNGILDRWGNQPEPGRAVLGWAQLRGIVPASANLDYMSAPSPVYIVENKYDANDSTYRWRPRGMPSPWEISRTVAG